MRANNFQRSLPPKRLLVTAVGLAVASLTLPVLADNAVQLDSLTVKGQQDSGYKTEKSSSAKYVKPLLDTPQTISVVPAEMIREQQALSLRQVLSNVSGITFNAGEGGGGLGDNINIRGFSANANMQIDGLRDSVQTSRTDTFNIEQVEVIKGPNSVFGGAGTTGGSINIISKQPQQRDFTEIGAGLGTDNYHRLTLDTNQTLTGVGVDSAVRLNLMAHENDVPGRDQIGRERWGIAPSLALGLSEATRLTLSYFHQADDNLPDYGVPARDGKKLAVVSREDYFGWKNLDKERIEQNVFTVNLEHDFSDALSLQNLTRYSRVNRETVVSASHVNLAGVPAGNYRPAGPQGYGRDVTTEMWINQTNLRAGFDTAGLGHELLTGVEVSRENLDLRTFNHGLGNTLYPGTGFDLSNPPGRWRGSINKTTTGYKKNKLGNRALYVFDSIALTPLWDLNLGLRYDQLDARSAGFSGARIRTERLSSHDEVLSSRAGLVYKPADNGRVYVARGTSFNPSAENAVSNTGGLTKSTQKLKPEKNEIWELGSKWELLSGRLMLDSALFRVSKGNARERLSDGSYILAGEQRVQGVELGATGKLSDHWKVYANYTFLDSETLKSKVDPRRKGQALGNTPPRSFNLWTTYEIMQGLTLGYGGNYVSKRNVTSSTQAKLGEYWRHNAMLGYTVNRNLDLQLNVNNLFDKDYVERVRQNIGTNARSSAIEYGDARSAMLSATYSF